MPICTTPYVDMVGYSMAQLELLELAEVLPHDTANEQAWRQIRQAVGETAGNGSFEGVLQQMLQSSLLFMHEPVGSLGVEADGGRLVGVIDN